MRFEENLQRLEAIVDELDGDELALDAALKLFEEGVELLRVASQELSVAETRIKLLIEQTDGLFETPDFDG
jgi:exodeoxyribonuclease VII small subunit